MRVAFAESVIDVAVPTVTVNPSDTEAIVERIIELHPTVLFILRFLAFSPDLPQVAFMNATNDTDKVTCPGAGNFPPKSAVCNPMNTITPKFAEVTASRAPCPRQSKGENTKQRLCFICFTC